VANHLNDITKDHPERGVAVLKEWLREPTPHREWIARHALRTLIKKGHPGALALLGFTLELPLRLARFSVESLEVTFGDSLKFAFEIESQGAEPLMLSIDYAIHHRKADGGLSPKVFKGVKRRIMPGERIQIERKHAIRPITTRRYYPGLHRVELLVNGQSLGQREFTLRMDSMQN
jgi:hypothetical protein